MGKVRNEALPRRQADKAMPGEVILGKADGGSVRFVFYSPDIQVRG